MGFARSSGAALIQGKFASAPRGGGSARACIRYVLGEEAAQKVEHAQRDDPLQASQKTDLAALHSEARSRADFGVGTVWSPAAGGGSRPSSIYCRGVWSLETAAYDIEAIARTQPRVKQPVQHIIISLNEAESRTIADKDLIERSQAAIDHAGFAGHQAIFTVHRDTDNAHCHVAVASVNAWTLKAWNRYHGWNRLHRALRELELEHGMEIEHGLAVVRDAGLPTQRIEPATKAERLAWARERGLAQERLEDLAHSFLGDAEGLELPDDRRERIVTKLRKMLADMHNRGEVPLRADVHAIAASLATTIEHGAPGSLRLRVMDRAQPGDVTRQFVDALGDTVQRLARWTPSTTAFNVPITEIVPDPRDAAQRALLADVGDLDVAEREVEELLGRDLGRPARDIVAAGNALFTVEDIDRWTSSRLSVGGPEWSDRILRDDPAIVVRSTDTEHPLLTTKTQLELEQHVFDLASALTRERNPLFDRAKLNRAIRDIEARETRVHGKPFRFTREQQAVFDVLEWRCGTCNGVAGAGKSTLMAVLARYCELTDQPVIGLATAQLAAENLARKSGIASVNSTRGLVLEKARGKELVEPTAVVVVDEYSMTSLEAAKEILDRIVARPNATVLFLGGGAQLGNILAGNTHRVLTEASQTHGHHRELTEVFRQRIGSSVGWMREAIPQLDKAILAADAVGVRRGFRAFDTHGHIRYHADRKSEIAGKADDIVRGYERGVKVIAPGVERIEALYINRAVRRRLGRVGKGILYQLEHRKREFSPDDRVVFTRNAERKLGVLNGYSGTVLAVDRQCISIKLDSGRTVDVNPEQYPHLEWGYAVTTHKSQGAEDPLVVSSITASDDVHSAFVALTRCTEELHVHTRLLPENTRRPCEEKHRELLEHLTSDKAMRLKDDALLFEDAVRRTGGDTPWAQAVRSALDHDADPLRQQHRAEMQERFAARGAAVKQLLVKTSDQRSRARALDPMRREKRLASIGALERRELESIDKHFELEPFVAWSVRRRKEIERGAYLHDLTAERRQEQHRRPSASTETRREGPDAELPLSDVHLNTSSDRHDVESLARKWTRVVGPARAATSRPIGIVGNQLIVEVVRTSTFNARDMATAMGALGRHDVDCVTLRIVERVRRQTQTPTRGEARRL